MIDVIYIAGVGHSGSTLLGQLIGTSDNAFYAGELKHFNNFVERNTDIHPELQVNKFKCDCGKTLKRCKFWKDMADDAEMLKKYPIYLYGGIAGMLPPHTYIVDASKDFKRLHYLARNSMINLTVIHLKRSLGSVIASYKKRGQSESKTTIEYNATNAAINFLIKSMRINFISLSYEELIYDPRDIIRILNNKFMLNIPLHYIKAMNEEQFHSFAGNPCRLKPFKGIKS